MSTKFRLVRCPRCRQFLVESQEVPLYKCGGCEIVLKAKNRENVAKQDESSKEGAELVPETDHDHISEEKEASSSSRDLTPPSTGKSSPDIEITRNLDESGECNNEQCEDRSFSNEYSSSPEVFCPEKKISSSSGREQLKQEEEGGIHPGKNIERCESELQNSNTDLMDERNSPDETPNPTEFTCHEAEFPQDITGHVGLEDESVLIQCNGIDQMEYENPQKACEGHNLTVELQSLPEYHNQENKLPLYGRDHRGLVVSRSFSPENNRKRQDESVEQGVVHPVEFDYEEKFSSGQKNESSALPAGKTPENDDEKYSGDQVSVAQGELISADLMSPDTKQLEVKHSKAEEARIFGRTHKVNISEASIFDDTRSELGVKGGRMFKSPTSKIYYAYEGSFSSFDETDDQTPDWILQRSRKHGKNMGYAATDAMDKRDGLGRSRTYGNEAEMQYWATSSSSAVLSGKQHHPMKSSYWNQEELPETSRLGHTRGNGLRSETNDGFAASSFTSRDFPAAHRNGILSDFQHNLLQKNTGILPDRPMYSDSEKMELLRAVYELKDQVNRMQISNAMGNGRFPAGVLEEKFIPLYYDHIAPERDMRRDLSYSRDQATHHLTEAWPHRRRVSRMTFSGEAAECRHQIDCTCLHCRHKDSYYSTQFPLHPTCYNDGIDHKFSNVLASGSSSPQLYTSSEVSSWGHGTKSDDQRYKDIEMKRSQFREKSQTPKRHLRPVTCGAPFVTCHHCSELLQLPADFLLFKKPYHRLRCNGCRKAMKFSLVNGASIVPYVCDASTPPPSEADEFSDAKSRRSLVPMAYSSSRKHAEPVSCSGDFGQSFDRSVSAEGDASFMAPSSDRLQGKNYDKKMSSGSSYEPVEDRKMKSIARESPEKNKNVKEPNEQAGPSSNVSKGKKASSEIQELPPSTNSPLHFLMGYSSVSQEKLKFTRT